MKRLAEGGREKQAEGHESWEGGAKRGGRVGAREVAIKLGRCLVALVLGAEGAVCHHFLCPHETWGKAMPAWRYAVFSPGC